MHYNGKQRGKDKGNIIAKQRKVISVEAPLSWTNDISRCESNLVYQGGCLGLWLGVGVAQMFLSSHQLLNHFLCRAASK